jgi:inosose dehydratase
LPNATIGAVPIIWNNVDVAALRHGTEPLTILDEIARIGFDGCQLGLDFPEGAMLRHELSIRGLRLAEVYASLPTTAEGPTDAALDIGRQRLRLLEDGGGEVLVIALDQSPGRVERAGRVERRDVPVLTDAGWSRLAAVLDTLAREVRGLGRRAAFHQHAGTFVETPSELERLAGLLDPARLGLCLDVGHYLVGGGDPAAALRAFGDRVTHVHLKDVDPETLDDLRAGRIEGFHAAVERRIFTELGAGVLDLPAVLGALADRDYDGWLMVEQDSSWGPPSESAAIGRRILAETLRRLPQTGGRA